MVGQAHSLGGALQLQESIKKSVSQHQSDHMGDASLLGLEWHINKVFVITRQGFLERFKYIDTIELGKQ